MTRLAWLGWIAVGLALGALPVLHAIHPEEVSHASHAR